MHKKFYFLIIIFIFSFFVFNFNEADAASLYFSPSSGSYNVGGAFTINVIVASTDQAMNATQGVVSFPKDKLEAVSLSKTGSIINLWIQEPSFSDSGGTVNFEGIVLNPGFTGSNGKIISILFRVKSAGNGELSFSSGSVLANDGKGTNILSSLGNAKFVLTEKKEVEIAPSPPPIKVSEPPSAPEITSTTHPDSEKWYAINDAEFSWLLTEDITALRFLTDKNFDSVPKDTYTELISEKEFPSLEDGIWYFHLRLRNEAGWSKTSHFRFQIDTAPPEPFGIKFLDGKETDNPQPTILFDTTDSLSGIDYYKIKIGEGNYFDIAPEIVKANPYTLPLQAPGKRIILVQAFDKAGNYTSASEEFIIKPIAPPIITDYSSKITKGETGFIKGAAYPDATVVVWFERQQDMTLFEKSFSRQVKSDQKGDFLLIIDKEFKTGNYTVWLETVDNRGVRSEPTEKLTISIAGPVLLTIGVTLMNLFAVVIPIVALFFLLLFGLWYGWHKFKTFKRRVRKEVADVDKVLHKSFDKLRNDVREQIKFLEKAESRRELTKEEDRVLEKLKKDLDDAEKFVKKEIEDIEREIK